MGLSLGMEKLLNKKAESEEPHNSEEDPRNQKGFKGDTNHPENKYNDRGDEGFLKQESNFVPIEEVPAGESEDDFINKLSEKMEKEMTEDEDKYDFLPLITGLVETAKAKGEKALDEAITNAAKFVELYRDILDSGLSDERDEKRESEGEEYEACRKAFKEIFGDIIYNDGKMEAYKHGYVKIAKPPVNAKGYIDTGDKIYYNKRGIGYLNEEEAKKSDAERNNRRNNYRKAGQKV